MPVFFGGPVFRHHMAVQIMMMIVVVGVDGNVLHFSMVEQTQILRVLRHRLGTAGTTHMLVQAQYLIGLCHDEMQIMGHHQNGKALFIAQFRQ